MCTVYIVRDVKTKLENSKLSSQIRIRIPFSGICSLICEDHKLADNNNDNLSDAPNDQTAVLN